MGIFHDENGSISQAEIVKDWFREDDTFSFMDWPPQSPELNPTENLDVLGKTLSNYLALPSSYKILGKN